MIDILPYVAEILEPTQAQIELSYNGITATLPLIVISETDNSSEVIVDGADVYSSLVIQLDLYHHTDEEVRTLATAVNGLMTSAGFRRSSSAPLTEDGMKRITLRYSASVDEINSRIYSGANQ